MSEYDRRFLERALALAERARGHTPPNPLVGAVLVREGRIVGEGYHPRAGEPHAEVFALRAAGEAARGATAYVSLEPCDHTGRTPPCSLALIRAGVARVVVAARDPNPEAAGGLLRLRGAGVEAVEAGWEARVREQNLAFFTAVEKQRPFVRLKAGATLDGRVADGAGRSQWITGEAARRVAHAFRQEAAAVAVGVGTVLADDPRLTTRDPDFRPFPEMREPPPPRDPRPVVFDTEARTPPSARVVARGALVLVGEWAPRDRVEALRAAGAEVLELPRDARGRVSVEEALRALFARGLTSLLLEGGPRLAGAFLEAGLVDRVSLFLAPKVLGEGRGLVEGFAPGLDRAPGFETLRVERVGEDLWLELAPKEVA
ncbi:MAG TPA: bifunctional diaminohydroxyphosphoribosylaminopyrimidine deaminase/5-amino-6-(5-phosphoribosylamino)uracil reductase RibD [Oceanithermus sp.]|nr:bifunctional diaminohydroxyphosphoribosylaminopyrimidine deaminase/5-amino-6-(5-phosphoribosylamino)uracil reductase RibD [Oceanithermus sp.]